MKTVQKERGTIAGGISILMIFLTLCIAIYSLLSLLTAQNELSLNKKNRDAAADYYTADASAAITLSEIATEKTYGEVISSQIGTIPISYDATTDTASFIVPIDKYRNLNVSITFLESSGDYNVNNYCVVNSLDWYEQAQGAITVITEFE